MKEKFNNLLYIFRSLPKTSKFAIAFFAIVVLAIIPLTVLTAQKQTVLQNHAAGCIPRPACLDSKPACEIPEPAEGWCPAPDSSPSPTPCTTNPLSGGSLPLCNPTPTPTGCYYAKQVCPMIACFPGKPCPTCAPGKLICPSPTPVTTPVKCGNFTCNPGQQCMLSKCPPTTSGTQPQVCDPIYTCVNPFPAPSCVPKLYCPPGKACPLFFPVGGWCPSPTPTPPVINPCPFGITSWSVQSECSNGASWKGGAYTCSDGTSGKITSSTCVDSTVLYSQAKTKCANSPQICPPFVTPSPAPSCVPRPPSCKPGFACPFDLPYGAVWCSPTPTPITTLKVGDINADGQVNISDYSILISCSIYSNDKGLLCSKNPSYKTNSDLNHDGKIDIDDLSIFIRALAQNNK